MAAKKKAPKGWTNEAIDPEISTEKPPPLDVAVYQAEIIDASPETSKQGGAQVSLILDAKTRFGQPEGGVAALAAAGKVDGRFYDYLSFEGFGLRKMKQVSVETGVDMPRAISEETAQVFCAELVGKLVWLRSNLEEVQDKQGNKTGEMRHRVYRYLTAAQCAEHAAALEGNAVPTEDADVVPAARRPGKRR
jgi:hypothetical protein